MQPRLECELRIRSSNGKRFIIGNIEVILRTTEVLNSPGHSFTSKSKLERSVIHYKKNIRISDKKIVGIDIPLTIALPDDIKETNFNSKFGHCFTTLECVLTYSIQANDTPTLTHPFSTVVNVERYDLLASPKLFKPLKRKFTSPDGKFLVQYKIENPCVTTDDVLHLGLEVVPKLNSNSFAHTQKIFGKKLKLKCVVFEVKEYLEVYDSHLDAKESTLQEVTKQFNEAIGDSGIVLQSDIRICTKNQRFKQYELSMKEPAVMYRLPTHQPDLTGNLPETILLKSKNNIEPFNYHSSITTRGKLFSITHGITMRFKISSAKDFEINQPIDISPWVKPQIKYIENIIYREKEIAKNARAFYESFGGIKRNKKTGQLEYPPLPPVVYTSDEETLNHLGIEYNKKFNPPRRVPVIE